MVYPKEGCKEGTEEKPQRKEKRRLVTGLINLGMDLTLLPRCHRRQERSSRRYPKISKGNIFFRALKANGKEKRMCA